MSGGNDNMNAQVLGNWLCLASLYDIELSLIESPTASKLNLFGERYKGNTVEFFPSFP